MNQVRTEDLLKYYIWQLERHNIKKDERKAKYEIKAAEYESKFLNRLFGWKYSDSVHFIDFDIDCDWFYTSSENFYADMIAECVYNSKINFMYMDLPTRSHAFYSWAADNNIPV